MDKLSHIKSETRKIHASQILNESPKQHASPRFGENQRWTASQLLRENHKSPASSDNGETHSIDASRMTIGDQLKYASRQSTGTQVKDANQHLNEIHGNVVSYNTPETHSKQASPCPNEPHKTIANQSTYETHATTVSQPRRETQTIAASPSHNEAHHSHADPDNGDDDPTDPVNGSPTTPAPASVPRLRFLVETYYDIQKLRIMTGNRIGRYTKLFNIDPKELGSVGETHLENYQLTLEKSIIRELKKELPQYNIYLWLRTVKGIGPVLAAGLIGWIGDISKFPNTSHLWSYAGLAPGQHRKIGEKSNWNSSLKTHCWKISESFVKTKGPYRELYLAFKKQDFEKHPVPVCEKCGLVLQLVLVDKVKKGQGVNEEKKDLTYIVKNLDGTAHSHGKDKNNNKIKFRVQYSPAHIHARAERKTVKLFLSHLWLEWRKLEGLPITEPYSIAILHHTGKEEPPK